jgi:two-component system, chemotaxis family, chemotaxis protein CheY
MKNILIVDDSSMVRLYYRDALVRAGFHVDEAFNGLEALEKVLASAPDLIIVDINMPKMDGVTFLQRLRRQALPLAAVPALVISTETSEGDVAAAVAAGANFYLVKPIAQVKLVQHAKIFTGVPA